MIRELLTQDRLRQMHPDEAAALLLVRQDAVADDYDDAVFDEWLAADPSHVEAWTRACSAWQSFDAAGHNPPLLAMREEALGKAPARKRWGLAVAASVAIIVATGGAFLIGRHEHVRPTSSAAIAAAGPTKFLLSTARGRRQRLVLADTSTVLLNTDTAIAVAFRPDGERRVELIRGQVFFKVAHDATRPFVVAVGDRTVTALGTAFEVRADRGTVRVVVVEGRVSVGGGVAAPVKLRAGQQLISSAGAVTISKADMNAVDEWQRGLITFKDMTLTSAATELNRYSQSQLEIDDPRIARLKVSGVFHTDDTSRFARTIQEIYPVRVVAAGNNTLKIVSTKPSGR